MKEIKMYRCDYCKKRYASKYRTRDHEKACWNNPELKACNTCYYNDYEGHERVCTLLPEYTNFPFNYPRYPVTNCESWEPSERYTEEEYESTEDF